VVLFKQVNLLDQGQCSRSLLTWELLNSNLLVLVSCGRHKLELQQLHFKLKRLESIKVWSVEVAWEDLSVGKAVMLPQWEAFHKLYQELLLHRQHEVDLAQVYLAQ